MTQRTDDDSEVVLERLKVYHRATKPVLEYYRERPTFRVVNGAQPPERVAHVVALGGVVERHLRLLVRLVDHGDGDAVVGPVAVRRPEVRVQIDPGVHVREPRRRPRVHRQV